MAGLAANQLLSAPRYAPACPPLPDAGCHPAGGSGGLDAVHLCKQPLLLHHVWGENGGGGQVTLTDVLTPYMPEKMRMLAEVYGVKLEIHLWDPAHSTAEPRFRCFTKEASWCRLQPAGASSPSS